MKLLLALAIAVVMFAGIVYAFASDDLQKLKNTGNCVNCDIRNADLRRTDLSDANLALAILERADFYGAMLYCANMKNTNMDGVFFFDTIMPDVQCF